MIALTHEADGNGKCARCRRTLVARAEKGEHIGVIESPYADPVEYKTGRRDADAQCSPTPKPSR